ncbi:MAG: phenylalanine--tRNA ligase subunit beta [Candidatus Binataceae bacterium]
MKLPLSWLGEFITLEAALEELCSRLTMAGLEVENVERIEPTFSGVYVAEVLGVERHPNADRLSLCEVDAGVAGRWRVVCGAPNVRAGMFAALAKVGACLAGGVHGEGTGSLATAVPLQAALIRGVQSEGMLCSELELALSQEHEGILELGADARPGADLADYLRMPDTVLDIAITPNRGDCLSIVGLAREIAALFGLKLKLPRLRLVKTPAHDGAHPALSVEIQAPEACPRYAALAMENIRIGPSPVTVRRRLELCGMRAVNNVVDATTYVMLELGQPLHAFDADRVAGGGIVVRRADNDRAFTTLDNVNRALDPADLLITDREKPLALAGVMGGRNSEVSTATVRIIFESAYFEPVTIARTARRLGLRSEASYRFERGIDRAGQVNALLRVAELTRKFAGGRESAAVTDIEANPAANREIMLDLGVMAALLGVKVPVTEVRRRLKAIGAKVSPLPGNCLKVIAPPFRPDLNQAADLAEEVARLPGLAEIPATLPTRPALASPLDPLRSSTRRARALMLGCGLVECRTVAFIAPDENLRFPGFEGARAVRVNNPLSAELSELRRSLLPGLLQALRFNLNREATAFHAFELGKVFGIRDGVVGEHERVAGVSFGEYARGVVGQPGMAASFATIKGIVETCLGALAVSKRVEFVSSEEGVSPYLHPGRAAQIHIDGEKLGIVGELHPAEMLRYELNSTCALFELDLSLLLSYVFLPRPAIETPPKYPAVRRDLALVLTREYPAAKILRALEEIGPALLESVDIFDVYEGSSIPQGKKSVALACRYRSKERTLTDEEVNRTHAALVEQAKVRLGAELRQ